MAGKNGGKTTTATAGGDRDVADHPAIDTADATAVVQVSGTVPPVAHGKAYGNGKGRAKSASELAYGGGALSLEEEIESGRRAVELLTVARSTFLPGYRKAVDSLAAGAALELATHVVAMMKSATHTRDAIRAATKYGPDAAMVSVADGSIDDSPAAATFRYADAVALETTLGAQLLTMQGELAVQLGPQIFRGRNVLGHEVTPTLGKDPIGYLASEAGATVELLGTIVQVQQLTGANDTQCPVLDDKQRSAVVTLVEPWKGRAVR